MTAQIPQTPSGRSPDIPPSATTVEILPVRSAFGGTVYLPGSKSLTNRALLVAALADGPSTLKNALDCDDSRHLIEALKKLGVLIEVTPQDRGDGLEVKIIGCAGNFPIKSGSFYLGNAGTATRFLTAALTIAEGKYVVDGDDRMRERPISQLVDALKLLGAEAKAPTGCPPVTVGRRRLRGGEVNISGGTSSQYISALLMVAPFAERRVAVRIVGPLVSSPYVDLTLRVMNEFGAKAFRDDGAADGQPIFRVAAGRTYTGCDHFVEGDASTASYFYAAAAITGDTVRVEGVGKESEQGDLRAADVLAEMGCHVKKDPDVVTVSGARGLLRGIDCDCADIPDVVPTLAVVAAFARGRTRLRGVPHLRHKESDRIASVATELSKIGAVVRELDDGLEIEGTLDPDQLHGAEIDTWGDHRIAMAFSLVGLMVPGIVIREPQVVTKSFPSYFRTLAGIGGRVAFRNKVGASVEES